MDEARWARHSSAVVYDGSVRIVEYAVSNEAGEAGRYEVDESIPYAVAVLIRDGDSVVLSRQYRFPVDRWIFDLPGGAGEPYESPDQAVRREAEEELGLDLRNLCALQTFYPNPGRSAWPVHLFWAEAVESGTVAQEDAWEKVRCVRLALTELQTLIDDGAIIDPSLLIAWHTAKRRGLLLPT